MELTVIRRHCRGLLALLSAGAFGRRRLGAIGRKSIPRPASTWTSPATSRPCATRRCSRASARRCRRCWRDIAPAERVASLTLPSDDVISTWVQDFEIEEEKSLRHPLHRPLHLPLHGRSGAAIPGRQQRRSSRRSRPSVCWCCRSTPTRPATARCGARQSVAGCRGAPKAPNVSLVPMVLPSGDVSDSTTLCRRPRRWPATLPRLTALAQRYGAGEVLVTEVRASPAGADGKQSFAVNATRYGREAPKNFTDTRRRRSRDHRRAAGPERRPRHRLGPGPVEAGQPGRCQQAIHHDRRCADHQPQAMGRHQEAAGRRAVA